MAELALTPIVQQMQQLHAAGQQLQQPSFGGGIPNLQGLKIPSMETAEEGFSMFLFGDLGTRKTTFAATAPKPIVLSCGAEGGSDCLLFLPQIFGIPVPHIVEIRSSGDMWAVVQWIIQYAKRAGFCSVVIDSLSYFIDLWISDLMMLRKKVLVDTGKAKAEDVLTMTDRDWGALETHIFRELAIPLHRTGLNIIWTAIEKQKIHRDRASGTETVQGVMPWAQGSAAKKLPGLCKMIVHATKVLSPDTKTQGRWQSAPTFWTAPTPICTLPRHRYGLSFPEGCLPNYQGYDMPTMMSIYNRVPWAIYTGPR